MRMGLERQGWTVEFANDMDPLKYEMYRAQFGDESNPFLIEDVHKIERKVSKLLEIVSTLLSGPKFKFPHVHHGNLDKVR